MRYQVIPSNRPEYSHCIQIGRTPTGMTPVLNLKTHNNMLDFHEARNWFSKTYGYGPKLFSDGEINEYWSWSIEYTNYLIYVKSDAELMFFQLAHVQDTV
jgi:hypothetical protein